MRNLLALIVFTFIMLLIGRNLTFLPRFDLFTSQKTEESKLKSEIKKIVSESKGTYSVYFADLNSGNSLGINEMQVHTGASLNKVPIIAALYYLTNKGKVDLDEKITLQKEDIQDYGTGSLRYKEPGGVYSLKTLAKLSLQQSDNTAAYIIATKIGVNNIQEIIEEWGLKQTDMANNKTSAYDTFLLFKKIYKSEVTSPSLTKELLGFMKDTDIEDRIPSLLPKDINVYHKTGDGDGNIHDGGIIEKGNKVFFLSVLTSDVQNKEEETKKQIAKIAKEIFNSVINPK